MPPVAEADPSIRQARHGIGAVAGVGLALLTSNGNALAHDNTADIEKQALSATKNAHTRSINSFPAPSAVATSQVVEAPTLASASNSEAPEATASSQLKRCVSAALGRPLVLRSVMFFPGDTRGSRQQSVNGFIRFKPTSAICAPLVSRETPTARMKMQRPNNHKKFIRSKRKKLIGNEDGVEVPMDANGSRYGYVAFSRDNGDGNKLRYRCTKGKGTTKAWITYNVRAASPVDGSTLGKRSFTQRIKISRTRPDLVRGNGVPGPC